MSLRLDVSIGPVQEFVAQSRRTRDLWGSSYLLAFLSSHAMWGAEQYGDGKVKVVQPLVHSDPLFRWVRGDGDGEPPRIGSAPNHFVVQVEGDPEAVAQAAAQAFERAWTRVWRAVWDEFIAPLAQLGEGTAEIWNRQVSSFWEFAWTVSSDLKSSAALARRKHWRSRRRPDEPGDKCTVVHDLQELSGYVRAAGREWAQRQDAFWQRLRDRLGEFDLRKDERLSAIALVKRLFPRVARAALGWEVDARRWASTVYVAALPWIQRVESAAPELAAAYASEVKRLAPTGALPENHSAFAGILSDAAGDFIKLDANYFHPAYVSDERLCPLRADSGEADRLRLLSLLGKLGEAQDGLGRKIGSPPAYYALLIADGDRLGKLVADLDPETVGQALSRFTEAAPRIVQAHHGVTVYAGGDDVLAMLPAPKALACADALADAYRRFFSEAAPGKSEAATLSAAVVFAHIRLPLNSALREGRRLLDEEAKDGNGRGSLAAGVLKRGGLHCQWTTAWIRRRGGQERKAAELAAELSRRLEVGRVREEGFSSALLYRLRDLLAQLCDWPLWRPGDWGRLPSGLDLHAFLKAEIVRTFDPNEPEADQKAEELADLVQWVLGQARGPGGGESPSDLVGVDALFLARFLAGGGYEEDRG